MQGKIPVQLADKAVGDRMFCRREWSAAVLCAVLISCLGSSGCQNIVKRGQSPQSSLLPLGDRKPKTKYIADSVGFYGFDSQNVQGVGLVMGLAGTGSDPLPSWQRDHLVSELKTRGDMGNTKELLADPTTSLVVIRGFIPAGARRNDTFDLEVILEPKSETTSLDGGALLNARLRPNREVGRKLLEGNIAAIGRGSLLIEGLLESRDDAASQIRATIPGGGVVSEDRQLAIIIRPEQKSVRSAAGIAHAINDRFTTRTRDGRVGVATAKNDSLIELMIPDAYRLNIGRYGQVISQIAFDESPGERLNRLEQLELAADQPDAVRESILRLEAIGKDAIPALNRLLRHANQEVRFCAAQSLAYLDQSDGIEELKLAAQTRPAQRWHALRALASLKDRQAMTTLASLMHEENAESRYGAFRALRMRSPEDALLRREPLDSDFYFHVIPSTASPLVHIASTERPEIVVFGETHGLSETTLFVESGLNVKSVGNGQIEITAFHPEGVRRRRTSHYTADVIRGLAAVGCSYSTVIRFLRSAKQAGHLDARLAMNAIPTLHRDDQVDAEAMDEYLERMVAVGETDGARPEPPPAATPATPAKSKGFFARIGWGGR